MGWYGKELRGPRKIVIGSLSKKKKGGEKGYKELGRDGEDPWRCPHSSILVVTAVYSSIRAGILCGMKGGARTEPLRQRKSGPSSTRGTGGSTEGVRLAAVGGLRKEKRNIYARKKGGIHQGIEVSTAKDDCPKGREKRKHRSHLSASETRSNAIMNSRTKKAFKEQKQKGCKRKKK